MSPVVIMRMLMFSAARAANIFSATPVIARTATYLYACTEWIDDAFQGREPLLEVYSRLLNLTAVSLANRTGSSWKAERHSSEQK